ncbi:MAG: T9SS type A sorting domain-containing protein, partial [Candidatus Eisenbacteria bacterium]|nr:T9SS type A sorting domain-containing protein [Candidatus Eisenbacteria bacterium]
FPVPPVFGALPFHGALELGDVDNDGHIDAATSHSGAASSRVMVHLGRGDGSFEESYQTSGFAYAYAQLHHLDSDGNLDLLFVSGPNAPPYDFFTARGNGDGTFQTVTRWIVNTCGSGHPAAYDIDEDGDLDVINTEDRGCSGSVQKYLYVSRNNGDGTFQSPYTIPIEFATRYVAAGDFDEDGHLDLVTGWPNWSLLRGHGDGTFDPEEPLPGASGSENTIPIDLDGDGHLDLATVGTEDLATAWLYVLWGDGSGGFSVSTFGGFPSPSGRVWLAAGDVDQDGDLDVMVDGVNDAVVMSNEDHREFQYRGRYGIGPASVSVHYADTDTDSLGDLIALAGGGITVIRGAVPLDPAATGEPGGAVSGGGPVLRSLSANPTRGLVRFSLELDTPEHFRIAVFDVQGRRMDLVHDGEVDRGAHAFAIDTSNWPSGVYSVRATATSGAVSERIVVR